MAEPGQLKRKAAVQLTPQRAANGAAVTTSAEEGARFSDVQHHIHASEADATSDIRPASRNIIPAHREGHMATSHLKGLALQSAERMTEEASVVATLERLEVTAPASQPESSAQKARLGATLSKHVELHEQPGRDALEPADKSTQTCQTTAQRVLNLPELLEPILLSVAVVTVFDGRHCWKGPKTVLLAQRVNKTWRLTVQTSPPLKQALWLEPDDEAEIDTYSGAHWNPIIWPQLSRPHHHAIMLDKEWIRSGSCSEQSWSKMIMVKSRDRFLGLEVLFRRGSYGEGSWSKMIMARSPDLHVFVKATYPHFPDWRVSHVRSRHVGEFIDSVKNEVMNHRDGDCWAPDWQCVVNFPLI